VGGLESLKIRFRRVAESAHFDVVIAQALEVPEQAATRSVKSFDILVETLAFTLKDSDKESLVVDPKAVVRGVGGSIHFREWLVDIAEG
jgi:hypothetical protein